MQYYAMPALHKLCSIFVYVVKFDWLERESARSRFGGLLRHNMARQAVTKNTMSQAA